MASHTFGSNNESNDGCPRDITTTIVCDCNLLHNICSCHFHIGVWDGPGFVGGSGIGLWPDPAPGA